MNDFFARRTSNASAVIHQPPASHLVRLWVAFSEHYPGAPADVEERLSRLLNPAAITVVMTDRHVTLVRARQAITSAYWSAVVGWLMSQPEVVFVAREYPLTRRFHGQAR